MAFLHDHARSRETTCYRAPPRDALQPPLRVRIAEELHHATTRSPSHEPIDPILAAVLIVLAVVAAGLLLGGLLTFAAAHPFPVDQPYYVN
jgi:hypothetical protein